MSYLIQGDTVYLVTTHRKGTVKSPPNPFTDNMVAVQWEDGTNQLVTRRSLISEREMQEINNQKRLEDMSIKKEECVVGKVVYQAAKDPPLARGKIVGPANENNLAIVEWDNGSITKKDIKHLLNEADGLAENKRLQDEKDRLEHEFEITKEAIAEKLAAAAKLINEAANIAANKDVSILDSMYEETRELEDAMENAGWRTSSWHC